MLAVSIAPLIMFKSLPYSNTMRILIATGVSATWSQLIWIVYMRGGL